MQYTFLGIISVLAMFNLFAMFHIFSKGRQSARRFELCLRDIKFLSYLAVAPQDGNKISLKDITSTDLRLYSIMTDTKETSKGEQEPSIVIASSGTQGNIYAILSEVRIALRKATCLRQFEPLCAKVYASKSYIEAIAEIRKVVDLYDLDGKI